MKVTRTYGESASLGLNDNLSNLQMIAEKREWKHWWMAPVPPPQPRGGRYNKPDVKATLCVHNLYLRGHTGHLPWGGRPRGEPPYSWGPTHPFEGSVAVVSPID